MPKPAVIVVNSHVVRGGVGGRASVFVLERLGFPVWALPTVQLSWHPGHGPARRYPTDPVAFDGFIDDLVGSPWLGEVGAIMSGYLGSIEQAAAIARLVSAVRARNPSVVYLCDPIVGDRDGLYQPAPVVGATRDRLLPLADIATPNRHELGWLTGRHADDNAGLAAAAVGLGVGEVVVTSAFATAGDIGNLLVTDAGARLASHRRAAEAPHGAGDLMAALYLGARLDHRLPAEALERASAVVVALIRLALELGADEMPLAAGQYLFDKPSVVVAVTTL